MDERDRVAVGRANRQAETLAGQPARVGDDSGGRGANVAAGRSADVDAPVLAAGIRVVLCDERPQDGSVDGPRPGARTRGVRERKGHESGDNEQSVDRSDNHGGRG
jgi:hypothetical protein